MIVYKDIATDDILFSDVYPTKLIDDCYYEIEGKVTTEDFTVSDTLIDANPSAEGGDEGQGNDAKAFIDIVNAYGLRQADFTKEEFRRYIRNYMKKLIEHVKENEPDRVANLNVKLTAKVTDILSNFDDYKVYYGDSINMDATVLLLNYRKDGNTPYFTVFKDLLVAEQY